MDGEEPAEGGSAAGAAAAAGEEVAPEEEAAVLAGTGTTRIGGMNALLPCFRLQQFTGLLYSRAGD